MPRQMTKTTPLDLTKLLAGPLDRVALDATPYAMKLAQEAGTIERYGKDGVRYLWRLTPKGRRAANRAKARA